MIKPTISIFDEHFARADFDIRKSHNARFMDQKVTPDVLSFIADCVVNFCQGDYTKVFSKTLIWHSDYLEKNARAIFSKPSAHSEKTSSEFDKFVAMPLKMLAYAGVLDETRRGHENVYRVNKPDYLEYLALGERQAFAFLYPYISKVLADSGLLPQLEEYIAKFADGTLSGKDYATFKAQYIRFMIGNTAINTEVEVRRIFPKVFNIIAVANGVPGSQDGHISDGPFYFSDLMYNRVNFRDISKSKTLSRQEAAQVQEIEVIQSDYRIKKAKDFIRKLYTPTSEVRDRDASGLATQVHHIFPESTYPAYGATLENLILLTPQQHNTKAHPGNRTKEVSPDYQIVCLLAKLDNIKSSIDKGEYWYSIDTFIVMLNDNLGMKILPHTSVDEIRAALLGRQNSI